MNAPILKIHHRIPYSLQKIFLASQRGDEVHEPPTDGSAYKMFRNKWYSGRNEDGTRGNKAPRRNSSGSSGARSRVSFGENDVRSFDRSKPARSVSEETFTAPNQAAEVPTKTSSSGLKMIPLVKRAKKRDRSCVAPLRQADSMLNVSPCKVEPLSTGTPPPCKWEAFQCKSTGSLPKLPRRTSFVV